MTETKPTQGQQIVQEMFEGNKAEKLNDQQQAEQMRNLGRQRDGLRQAQSQHTQESDSNRGEKARGEQSQPRQATRGRQSQRAQREAEFDNFIQRNTTTQKHKDAGKELTRHLRHNPQTAQAWSVAGSRHTSTQARQAILARQGQAQGPTRQAVPPRSGTQFIPQGRQPTFQQTPARAEGLAIQYGNGPTRGTPQTTRPFAGRYLTSQQISRHFGLWMQSQQMTNRSQQPQPGVMVEPRGPFLFVRDGKKFRAFRMNRDGSLSELPSEDSSEQPLSGKAREKLRRVIRQRLPHSSAERRSPSREGISAQLDKIIKSKAEGSKEGSDEASLETRFAMLLHEVLQERKKFGRQLKEGEDAEFPEKSDWAAFFARLMGLGNEETQGKKTLDQIMSLLFRGMFQKKGAGKYLVGDLKFLQGGKGREEKFAQIPISQEGLLKLLAGLKPGQQVSLDALKKFLGEELTFLKMAHRNQKKFNLAEGAEKNVSFNPKANVDPYSQARLERALFAAKKPTQSTEEKSRQDRAPSQTPQGVFANVYELMGLRQRLEGRSKFYTVLSFLIFGSAIGLAVTLLLFKLL